MVPANGTGKWHLEKSVSVGHIFTTIVIAGSVLAWAMKMDSRVSVLENDQWHAKQTDERIERLWREDMNDIKQSMLRIEAKLDGKADKDKR